jgi:pSer/pThr/pTyr-binding forkhead associated (FHA) protein
MMRGRKGNNLIVIESGQIRVYTLDDKMAWELGRPSKDNNPDIKFYSPTVSRKHGKFQNMDGIWFYLDYNGKNGTIYNHKHIETGLNGRIKPIMLKDGDIFVFGGGAEEVINCKTVWAMFSENCFDDQWRVVDSKGYKTVSFVSEEGETKMTEPAKGTVIRRNSGIAIYMEDLTYLIGDMGVVLG